MPTASDSTGKLLRAAQLAVGHLPESARADFAALFEPATIAITTSVFAAWAASHVFGIGFLADVLLLLAGVVALGAIALQAAEEIRAFVVVALDAKDDAGLDRAGAHLAKAVTLIGVQAFVAFLTRGVGKRVQTPALYAARVSRIDRLIAGIGTKHQVPQIRQRITVALTFFEESFPKMNDEALLSRLRAIDFHGTVEVVELPKGTRLVAYKSSEHVLHPEALLKGDYYATSGTPAERLGIVAEGRTLVRYETTQSVKVLRSRAAPAMDRWSPDRTPTFEGVRTASGRFESGQMVGGGGVQYILPAHVGALRVVGISGGK
ncbi:MAG: hypothetical protein JNK78_13270 [Planctomycetes bacterium]|nr:hypothetical protein [Planctomycetota bacterium]